MAFGRRSRRSADPVAATSDSVVTGPAPDVRPAPQAPANGWRDLPPIQRAITRPAFATRPETFQDSLASWQNPIQLAPLGHVVDPSGAGGRIEAPALVAPIARAVQPPPALATPPAPEPPKASLAQRAVTAVQRAVGRRDDAPRWSTDTPTPPATTAAASASVDAPAPAGPAPGGLLADLPPLAALSTVDAPGRSPAGPVAAPTAAPSARPVPVARSVTPPVATPSAAPPTRPAAPTGSSATPVQRAVEPPTVAVPPPVVQRSLGDPAAAPVVEARQTLGLDAPLLSPDPAPTAPATGTAPSAVDPPPAVSRPTTFSAGTPTGPTSVPVVQRQSAPTAPVAPAAAPRFGLGAPIGFDVPTATPAPAGLPASGSLPVAVPTSADPGDSLPTSAPVSFSAGMPMLAPTGDAPLSGSLPVAGASAVQRSVQTPVVQRAVQVPVARSTAPDLPVAPLLGERAPLAGALDAETSVPEPPSAGPAYEPATPAFSGPAPAVPSAASAFLASAAAIPGFRASGSTGSAPVQRSTGPAQSRGPAAQAFTGGPVQVPVSGGSSGFLPAPGISPAVLQRAIGGGTGRPMSIVDQVVGRENGSGLLHHAVAGGMPPVMFSVPAAQAHRPEPPAADPTPDLPVVVARQTAAPSMPMPVAVPAPSPAPAAVEAPSTPMAIQRSVEFSSEPAPASTGTTSASASSGRPGPAQPPAEPDLDKLVPKLIPSVLAAVQYELSAEMRRRGGLPGLG